MASSAKAQKVSSHQQLTDRLTNYLQDPDQAVLWELMAEFSPDPAFTEESEDYLSESDDSDYTPTSTDHRGNKSKKRKKNSSKPSFSRKLRQEYTKRDVFTTFFAWAVPSRDAIDAITEFTSDISGPIVEVGAGRGLWAHLLQLNGVDMIPTDLEPARMPFTHIEAADSLQAVTKFLTPGGCLMSCWPNGASRYVNEALRLALSQNLVEKVIYIGEAAGGCTGNDELFDILDQNFMLMGIVNLPHWYGVHDKVYLYQLPH
jgi:hypothetical protein